MEARLRVLLSRGGELARMLRTSKLEEVAVDADRAAVRARANEPSERAWRELAAGRAKVVDHFERDGRCYLVLLPSNDAGCALSEREIAIVQRRLGGWRLKEIAEAIGVSISTTAKSLHRAISKLGLRNEAELIAVLGVGGRQ